MHSLHRNSAFRQINDERLLLFYTRMRPLIHAQLLKFQVALCIFLAQPCYDSQQGRTPAFTAAWLPKDLQRRQSVRSGRDGWFVMRVLD